MALRIGLEALGSDPALVRALADARRSLRPRIAAPPSVTPYLAGAIARQSGPTLFVTASDRAADSLAAQLRDFVDPSAVAVFPAWETLPHERLSPSGDTIGARMAVLRRLAHPDDGGKIDFLVAPVRAVVQPIVRGLGDVEPVRAAIGDSVDLEALVAALVELGFERVQLVDRRGQIAVRGGIVDVFPPAYDHPVRIEFWADTIEDIRAFAVSDQRSLGEPPTSLHATACKELLITADVRQRAQTLSMSHPELGDILEKVAQGIAVEGMESLIPVLTSEREMLLDVLGPEWTLVECEPERVSARVAELVTTSDEFLEASWHNAAQGHTLPIDLRDAGYRSYEFLESTYPNQPWLRISSLKGADDEVAAIEPVADYRSDLEQFAQNVRAWWASGLHVVLVMAGPGSASRVVTNLSEFDIPARVVDQPTDVEHVIDVVIGHQDRGAVIGTSLVVITESDLFSVKDAAREPRSLPSRRRSTIDPLTLSAGDYVVHDQHGVARYREMISRTVQGATREYMVLEYAASKRGQPSDQLLVPTDQLDHITRYVGGESPSLNRLGGSDWAATKARARKAVRQIAGELIRLYAARMASKGHAFGPDSPWQRELEDAFEFVETPDQLSTINEVKADMERAIPMDRLVCGDVGYGKTEIAVRAAFKAVQDGKQVAVLVPTTLLVQQHMATFARRYAAFPVKLAALSRFQTPKETAAVIEGITDGSIDIVIGTHRLFNPDVRFRDLGLVIVDEEQRFGVEHKEHLKALRTNVDMLTMSATPIPRTLEMAVTGLREMSTIQTPPEERHPVLTSVGPYDEKFITAAIHRELLRDGQVFFVHNRVESINRVASKVRELVPEARVEVAHGQMNEHQLEQVIVDFWQHKFDVLVSTTIIESGLDIPNANTLIVDRAENYGLSQLHQLRGRVGRSRERGYAYFLYSPDKPLTETAHDRLATIAAHTDLGSGIAVAMKDLEIRGAGNLLGGEQSGHIAEVGFDLYIRMVSEAVNSVKDEADTEGFAVKVELPIDAHIPRDYLPDERLRMEAYRRLADAHSTQGVEDAQQELIDRYGPLPQPVEALIGVAHLRVLLHGTGVNEAVVTSSTLRLHPVELAESRQVRLARMYPGTKIQPATRTIVVPRPRSQGFSQSTLTDTELLEWVTAFINDILV